MMMKYTQGSHTSGPENFKVLHLNKIVLKN